MYKWTYQTKLGTITIGATTTSITYLKTHDACNGELRETDLILKAHHQLNEYLEGQRKNFDLPLEPRGTDFQRHIWKILCDIPYGKTITYTELAKKVGNPKAIRAAGAANGKNPIYIIIPCHRVIATSGNLTGYAGGLAMKEKLLKLEGVEF